MERLEFIKTLALGAVGLAVAPEILAKETPKPEVLYWEHDPQWNNMSHPTTVLTEYFQRPDIVVDTNHNHYHDHYILSWSGKNCELPSETVKILEMSYDCKLRTISTIHTDALERSTIGHIDFKSKESILKFLNCLGGFEAMSMRYYWNSEIWCDGWASTDLRILTETLADGSTERMVHYYSKKYTMYVEHSKPVHLRPWEIAMPKYSMAPIYHSQRQQRTS